MSDATRLPVEEVLPQLQAALRAQCNAVLVAPPGAGKSTVAPLALLGEGWAAGKKILLLEPRRLAARAVAARMAQSLGEQLGATVGYRMRLDTRVGPATRLEVVTEGVLTRMLQQDPALEGVAAVLFDEFHERSLHADLGLALCLQAQETVAPQLRLLVMSATIGGRRGDAARQCPGHRGRGRVYPGHPVCGKGLPALPQGRTLARVSWRAWLRQCAHFAIPRAMCWCSCPARRRSIASAICSSRRYPHRKRTCMRCMATWTWPRSSGCWNRRRPGAAN
jgi:hypothetical protein